MICPACETPTLIPQKDETSRHEIDTCTSCSGLWFDPDELARFLVNAKNRITHGLAANKDHSDTTFTINTSARKCPRCSTAMDTCLFGGINLDRCASCRGLWFDQDELELVIERYRSGAHGDREIAQQLRLSLGDPDMPANEVLEKQALLASVEDFLKTLSGGH